MEAKAFQADGVTEITETDGRSYVETTGNANKLSASADRTEITADGKDLSFITIDVTDSKDRFVNGAEPEITVTVEGDGQLLALDNGLQNDVTCYLEPTRKAGKGKLLAIVQSTTEAGSFTVKASAAGYIASEVTVKTEADGSGAVGEKSVVSYEISRNYYVKQGQTPVLPTEVKVNYSDDTYETKSVTWGEIPEEGDNYSVFGTIDDLNLAISANVSVIGSVAGVLNYSAAIGQGAEFTLPSTRPVAMSDGTILAAEFPVAWENTENITDTLGTKIVKGTAEVFDQTFEVTASVRVTNGEYIDGEDALPNVPEMYINGVSSWEDADVASALAKLQDDKTTAEDAAWSGTGTLDVRLDTAIELKDMTLYIKDTAPTSDTIKVYASGNNGVTWEEADCTVTNQREDGVTVRTYTCNEIVSETWFRVEFTKNTTLTEWEMNTRIPSFAIGNEAALEALRVGDRIADESSLEKGWFGVADTDLDVSDVTASGKDNASVTILPKDSDNVIRLILESEDHSERSIYPILLGGDNSITDNASDDSMDYPYADMTITAPSIESSGSAAKAADGDTSTNWHTNWGSGSGSTDLRNDPDNRYVQIALKETAKINGLRYIPRDSEYNGIVTEYRVEVSTDGNKWEAVASGEWSTSVEWKLASFAATEAKYVRLYGVATAGNSSDEANQFMSAAEIRVRYAAAEIYSGNTTVELEKTTADYNGSAITPVPVITYKASENAQGVVLTEGTDYEVSYRNNVQPGQATVVVTGKNKYFGVIEAAFTIEETEKTVNGYETVEVTVEKGEYPALPGTVIAETSLGEQIMEVCWDTIAADALEERGSFTVYGTVVDNGVRVEATVTVCDVIGVQQVTAAVQKGAEPELPEQVLVYYSNGDAVLKDVTWELSGVSFVETGMVEVTGKVGNVDTAAHVRVGDAVADAYDTPQKTNLALNENGESNTKEWPRTFAYVAPSGDPVHHVTDGIKNFDSTSSKVIWSDWESGVYHTNADAAVGASDHLPFVVTAFGVDGSADNADQKKYTVNKVSIGFMEEDASSTHKVRLPEDYKIEYYSGNDGVIDASRLSNSNASECSNVKGWGTDNPLKAHDGWTEVTYTGGKPAVPDLDSFKQMTDIYFEAVETTAIRITLTPQAENWTGLEEIEVYYIPVAEYADYEVTSIQIDGTEMLAQFDAKTKTLQVDAEAGVITAEATNNASITVLEAVNGTAKVIFLPENGDEGEKQEYTVNFKETQETKTYLISSWDDRIQILKGRAAEGDTVTFKAAEGYAFAELPKILRSADNTETSIAVTETDGVYSFQMPAYGVLIKGTLRTEEEVFAEAKQSLKQVIDLAGALKAEDYTEETYAVLLKELQKAQSLYADVNATAE